jgi:hypothetical protein
MISFIKQLFGRKVNASSKAIQDELLGFWENDADDGSGLHAIWGYGIEFLEDGKGFSHYWGSEVEPSDRKTPISWKRDSATNIMIKLDTGDDWRALEYEITDFIGAYNSKHFKLTEKGKNGFWNAPEPLYKIKR